MILIQTKRRRLALSEELIAFAEGNESGGCFLCYSGKFYLTLDREEAEQLWAWLDDDTRWRPVVPAASALEAEIGF